MTIKLLYLNIGNTARFPIKFKGEHFTDNLYIYTYTYILLYVHMCTYIYIHICTPIVGSCFCFGLFFLETLQTSFIDSRQAFGRLRCQNNTYRSNRSYSMLLRIHLWNYVFMFIYVLTCLEWIPYNIHFFIFISLYSYIYINIYMKYIWNN